MGIVCIPGFLGRGGDIHALVDHIDYMVKRFGPDHVSIGTDIAHSSVHSAAESRKIGTRPRRRPRFEYFWPPGALSGGPPAGLTLEWTNWPLFTVGMVQRGCSDTDIQKILGGSVLRVARAPLAG